MMSLVLQLMVHPMLLLVQLSRNPPPVWIWRTKNQHLSLHPTITPSRFLLALTLQPTRLQIFPIQQVKPELRFDTLPLSKLLLVLWMICRFSLLKWFYEQTHGVVTVFGSFSRSLCFLISLLVMIMITMAEVMVSVSSQYVQCNSMFNATAK